MNVKYSLIILLVVPVFIVAWQSSQEDKRMLRRGVHYHSKRHMAPKVSETKRRTTSQKPRELRKKPSGHLTPLEEDDIDNDEFISVAIGPPPMRPKYDKVTWKHMTKNPTTPPATNYSSATNLVKDVLTQLGREFLTHQVNEDFVFGQYVGNSMKNFSSDVRLKMQHDILELIVKYQKLNRGELSNDGGVKSNVPNFKDIKVERKYTGNDTDDTWPDFSNLAKIVG